MKLNSRGKGKRGEREVVEQLRKWWPEAARNLDQFGDNKEDVLHVPGVHFQIKRVGTTIRLWEALQQAESEAKAFDIPILVFRRDRGQWYGALPLDELIALLRLREK